MIGVHFTTLRRWADAGHIEYMRTPGGKRRFNRAAIQTFLDSHRQGSIALEPGFASNALVLARQQMKEISTEGQPWLDLLTTEQRTYLRGTGNRLMALLMQYGSREGEGDIFLEEGRKIAREYGEICYQIGMTVAQSVDVFLLFRRPILDAIHETGTLNGFSDMEGRRIYQKSMHFLDDLLTAMVEQFSKRQNPFLRKE